MKTLLSNGMVWGDKGSPGKGSKSDPDFYDPKQLLAEMQSRMKFNIDFGTSVLSLTVKTFKQEAGHDLIQKYISVWMDKNLEGNKKEARAISYFAMKQRDDAYQAFKDAETEMISFRKTYQMPADQQVARDPDPVDGQESYNRDEQSFSGRHWSLVPLPERRAGL